MTEDRTFVKFKNYVAFVTISLFSVILSQSCRKRFQETETFQFENGREKYNLLNSHPSGMNCSSDLTLDSLTF